jgi:predicted ATP-dependent endonuclease of OLD family
MKLTNVELYKYKSITETQQVDIEKDITVLVGKNEAGKTAFLEALAKTNYFEDDSKFVLEERFDYPRSELKKVKKDDEKEALKCTYSIGDELRQSIQDEFSEEAVKSAYFTISYKYGGGSNWYIEGLNDIACLTSVLHKYTSDEEIISKFESNVNGIHNAITFCDGYEDFDDAKEAFETIKNGSCFTGKGFRGYIVKKYLKPNMPKFWYFDEYYALPGNINLNELQNEELEEEELRTAKALIELAEIDLDDVMQSDNFETLIAELEATSNMITDEIFKYWSTNGNIEIEFKVDKQNLRGTIQYILDVRVKNKKHRITLPLKNRSKGFNWFFSFIVWFKKIQSVGSDNFILLLDEPGLNLHASAQADLLRFIEDLSEEGYQIIYSTHSPFMVETKKLNRVRTVFDGDNGTVISESVQEKDPNTLFPLQAALGYDIAQNLFVSKKNLIVEGVSDLTYLTLLSSYLHDIGREGLNNDITIVPVGGLDKVPTFISLLRGSSLGIVCLLDSYTVPKTQAQALKNLIENKIIKESKILFFHDFASHQGTQADIEDVFSKEEYTRMFNDALGTKYSVVDPSKIDLTKPILGQINREIKEKKFNHYSPANKLAQSGVSESTFSEETLDRFEALFQKVNSLF